MNVYFSMQKMNTEKDRYRLYHVLYIIKIKIANETYISSVMYLFRDCVFKVISNCENVLMTYKYKCCVIYNENIFAKYVFGCFGD